MRGMGGHKAPEVMQPCPADNTSDHVMAQARRFLATGRLVNTEVAREIAAWWQTPVNGFAVFASTGMVPDGFKSEIEAQLRDDDNNPDDLVALRALLAYVEAVRS